MRNSWKRILVLALMIAALGPGTVRLALAATGLRLAPERGRIVLVSGPHVLDDLQAVQPGDPVCLAVGGKTTQARVDRTEEVRDPEDCEKTVRILPVIEGCDHQGISIGFLGPCAPAGRAIEAKPGSFSHLPAYLRQKVLQQAKEDIWSMLKAGCLGPNGQSGDLCILDGPLQRAKSAAQWRPTVQTKVTRYRLEAKRTFIAVQVEISDRLRFMARDPGEPGEAPATWHNRRLALGVFQVWLLQEGPQVELLRRIWMDKYQLDYFPVTMLAAPGQAGDMGLRGFCDIAGDGNYEFLCTSGGYEDESLSLYVLKGKTLVEAVSRYEGY